MFWGAQSGGCGGNACRSPQERYFGFSIDFNKAQETIVLTVIPPVMQGEPKRQRYERTTTHYEGVLFRGNRCPPQGEYHIQANVYLIEPAAPIEELLTVAIDDTANTLFITGITGFLSH